MASDRNSLDDTPHLWRPSLHAGMASGRNSLDDNPRLWRSYLHDQGLPNEWHARARADHEQRQQDEAAPGDLVTRYNTSIPEECSLTRPDCFSRTCVHWKRRPLRNSWLATPSDISKFSPENQQKHREMQEKRERDDDIIEATRRTLGYGYDTAEQDNLMEHFQADKGKMPGERGPIDPPARRPSSANKPPRRPRYSKSFPNESSEGEDSLADIPQRYLDEADRMWHEWEEDNDADQYMSDIMHKAPWREVHKEESAQDFGILPSAPRLRYTYEQPHQEEEERPRQEEEVVSKAPRFPYNEREYEPPRHGEEIVSNAPRSSYTERGYEPRREEEMASKWSESSSAFGAEGKDTPAVVPWWKLIKKEKLKKGDDADKPQKKGDDTDKPQRRLSMKKLKDGFKKLIH